MNFHTVSRQPKKPSLRVAGRSAVAAVAYALTTSLKDERIGQTFNYAHGKQVKARETIDLGLYFPGGKRIKQNGRDPHGIYSDFWSKVELAEKRKDARTARTIVVALPVEMERSEHQTCLEDFQRYLASEYGMASQVGIHYDHEHNPHAHIITTTRKVTEDGELGEKIRILDSARSAHYEIKKIGEAWAEINNKILLPKYGTSITHKSYQEQGIDKPKGEHLGPKKWRELQTELKKLAQLEQELREELSHGLGEETERGTVQSVIGHSEKGIYGGDRRVHTEETRRGIQQAIEGSSRGKNGEPERQTLSAATSPVQPVGTQRPADETPGEMRSSHSRDREKANFFPGDHRNQDRKDAGQAGSNHGRPTPTAKRSPSDAPGAARRAGKPDHKIRNNWQAESTLDKLIFLENKLEDLNEFFALKQLQDKQQENLISRLDKALDNLQTLFELEALKRSKSHVTRNDQSDTTESELSSNYKPRGPKA